MINSVRGYLLLFLYGLLWAAKDVLVTVYLSVRIDTLTILLNAIVYGAVVSGLIFICSSFTGEGSRATKKTYRFFYCDVFTLSLCTAGAYYFLFRSLFYYSPSVVTLVDSFAYMSFLAIGGVIFLNEKLKPAFFLFAAVSVLGLTVFMSDESGDTKLFDSVQLLSIPSMSLLFAASILIVKRMLARGVSSIEIVFWRMFPMSLVASMWLFLESEIVLVLDFLIVAIIVFGFVMPYYVSFMALKHLSAGSFGMVSVLIPIISFLLSIRFLDEQVTCSKVLGVTIVLTSMLCYIWTETINNAKQ